tara:strand:+ start:107 stop:244 length:138 start_codon:yes stop_codon:yes gene_type:complete
MAGSNHHCRLQRGWKYNSKTRFLASRIAEKDEKDEKEKEEKEEKE